MRSAWLGGAGSSVVSSSELGLISVAAFRATSETISSEDPRSRQATFRREHVCERKVIIHAELLRQNPENGCIN